MAVHPHVAETPMADELVLLPWISKAFSVLLLNSISRSKL